MVIDFEAAVEATKNSKYEGKFLVSDLFPLVEWKCLPLDERQKIGNAYFRWAEETDVIEVANKDPQGRQLYIKR